MSKLSQICLLLLTIFIVMSNLSSVESDRSDKESANYVEHRIRKRIVGGWFTDKHQDTVFKLVFNGNKSCTGTFVASDSILTTAHCCKNVKSKAVSVYNVHYHTLNVTVLKYHINPNFNYKAKTVSNYDIAIIELTTDIEGITPAKLDYSGVECGETVWMYGYGRTEFNRTGGTIRLKELPAKVDKCTPNFGNFRKFLKLRIRSQLARNDMIFTHAKKGSMCFGDSGGPVINKNGAIVGVHSGGGGIKCSTKEASVVRLSSHKRFIQTALHQNSASSTLNLNSIIFFILISFYIIY